jgi:hypothetical protein
MESTFYIARYQSCRADEFQNSKKSSRMWNHLAHHAFPDAGYNRFSARAKLHNRDQANSDSLAIRTRMRAQVRRLINQNYSLTSGGER